MMVRIRLKAFSLLLAALIPLVIFVGIRCSSQAEADYYKNIKIVDNSQRGLASVGLYYDVNHDSDTWYAFLPSMMNPEDAHIVFKGCDHIEFEDINGKHYIYTNNSKFTGLNENETYYIEFCDKNGNIKNKGKFIFMQSKNVPAMFINTESGDMDYIHKSKKNKEAGEMLLMDPDGGIEYFGRLDSINGRGNTSWGYEKKPYAITLEKGTALLGMGRSKNWALIANYVDRSEVRDKLVKYLASLMDMKYTPKAEFVDLYCNGEYRGLYLLSEKIEVAEERLDIDDLQVRNRKVNYQPLENYGSVSKNAKEPGERRGYDLVNPEDISGGYLIEKNYLDRYSRFPSRFRLNSGEKYCIRSPYYASIEEVEYIASIMQKIEDGASAGTDISDYADLKSFADKYLLEEFVGNEASGATSSFFYKDSDSVDPHIYAGPVWDYDKSLGNSMNPYIDDVRHLTFLTAHDSETRIFYNLYSKSADFRKIVKEEYTEKFRPVIDKAISENSVYDIAAIPLSDAMEYMRWQGNAENTANEVENVEQYMIGRMKFFDDIFIENDEICIVTFNGEHTDELGILRGEAIGEFPKAKDKGKWVNAATGEEISEMSIVTENMTLDFVKED